jgi:4-amino-4-deoxy-L-arabinose transferase-like glycosyltransferase
LSSIITQRPESAPACTSAFSRESFGVLAALCIGFITLCHGLGQVPLMWPDEGRNAEVAREMEGSGRWLVPTYIGADYLDKPAFYFKAVALSLATFGDTELGARVPSAASAFFLLVLTYLFCRRVCGSRCATLAAIAVATTPLFVAYARIVIFDMMLTLFTCAAIFAGFLAEENQGVARRNWYLLGAVAAGLGTLVKGPVGFIVPALVLLVFNAFERRTGAARRLLSPLNLLAFFAVVLPWFIGLSVAHPDFPRYGLIEESFHRFTTGSFQRSKPIYFYPLIIATTFFPWSLLLPGAIIAGWKRRSEWSRLDRLCVIWTIVVLIFFSFSNSKMPGYILSLVVSLGILLARLVDRALGEFETDLRRIPLQATTLLGALCLIGAILALYLGAHPMQLQKWFRVHEGDLEQIRAFWSPLAAYFLVISLVAVMAIVWRSVEISFAALAGFTTVAILLNLGILEFAAMRRSARHLSVELASVAADAKVACLECLPHGLPFYLRRPVTLLTKDGAELTSNYVLFSLKQGSPWPPALIPIARQDAWLNQQMDPVALIARTGSRSVLDQIATKRGGRVLGLTPEYCVLLLPARTTG